MKLTFQEVRHNLQREGFPPAAIAEIVLGPAFGENDRTRALERWHDLHVHALRALRTREQAIWLADNDRNIEDGWSASLGG